jgi:hypothetical protein
MGKTLSDTQVVHFEFYPVAINASKLAFSSIRIPVLVDSLLLYISVFEFESDNVHQALLNANISMV